MYSVILLFWVMASIIIGNPKSKSNRWLFAFGVFIVFGLLTIPLEDQIIPWLNKNESSRTKLISGIRFIDALFTTLFHYFVPYTFFMFSITFTGHLNINRKFIATRPDVVFFLPVLLMYIIFPVNSPSFNPDYNPHFFIIAIWAIPYILCADLLFIHSLIKEKDFKIRRDILISSIIIVPGSIFILLTCYILVVLNIRGGYRYYLPAIAVEFIIFSIVGVKYGVFGIKLKVEKNRLDRTMKAMTSGTTILNHAYKNEIFKISMSVNNIKKSEEYFKKCDFDGYINDNLRVITNSVNHMLDMSSRIQEYMQDIMLKEGVHRLDKIITNSLESMLNLLEQKSIKVLKDYDCDMEIICDDIHMYEVLSNIFKNAIEAMNSKGCLIIRTYKNRSGLYIEIKDDGKGISKDTTPYIFDPFFSTKNRKSNFGLGLSYCYNIMQKHGGEITVKSEENVGTTVYIKIPNSKVNNYKNDINTKKHIINNI